ncbi:hypothetical protein QJS04_geneDACA006463 [Acorus gramineus]|uniref:Uncharacterized protein n=1 Tax=Acorus gramineus TaxID=55184 RepID=A0AAV9AXP6_ACOGR|nr:hypothetical protein QJS04_geneDACA006463 [Acorus gramineus]
MAPSDETEQLQNPNPNPNNEDGLSQVAHVTYDTTSYNRAEKANLKRKLETELNLVRACRARLESESKSLADAMKKCKQILRNLLKQRTAWIFKEPVDTVKLGLHDYRDIVKQPMDLGTVRARLYSGQYSGPLDFASDVRLTFDNALTYNPSGHVVHEAARRMLKQFETAFSRAHKAYVRARARAVPARRVVRIPLKGKKREMSVLEKQRLVEEVMGLPAEELEAVVGFLRRRNPDLGESDDIEIDVDAMDDETLWELDRIVRLASEKVNREEVVDVVGVEEEKEETAAAAAAEVVGRGKSTSESSSSCSSGSSSESDSDTGSSSC